MATGKVSTMLQKATFRLSRTMSISSGERLIRRS